MANEKPDYVFLAAAKVGGIIANNTYRAEFLYDNIQMQNNVIHYSYVNGVKKLMFLGSSCIYPKLAPQPLINKQVTIIIMNNDGSSKPKIRLSFGIL